MDPSVSNSEAKSESNSHLGEVGSTSPIDIGVDGVTSNLSHERRESVQTVVAQASTASAPYSSPPISSQNSPRTPAFELRSSIFTLSTSLFSAISQSFFQILLFIYLNYNIDNYHGC